MRTIDTIVVGGGLVGSAIAWGLRNAGEKEVAILDENDNAFRASRGNFGLVWVQGKGFNLAEYAEWSLLSAQAWRQLAEDLHKESGVDVVLEKKGGLSLALSKEDLEQKVNTLTWLQQQVGSHYQFEVLDHQQLKELVPTIGETIPGATFTKMDGHVNPLKLLLAYHRALMTRNVKINSNVRVHKIEKKAGIFHLETSQGDFTAKKVVLAAGLANKELAAQVGINAPVQPNRGQVLITERLPPLLSLPSNYVRQTDEGTIQLGDSLEDVGYNDWTKTSVLEGIAQRAIRCFPILKNKRIVRSWAALRVMSPDGFPIYDESKTMSGAYVVTCHSGVTLAANHAYLIAPWVAGGDKPLQIAKFSSDRFTPNHSIDVEIKNAG